MLKVNLHRFLKPALGLLALLLAQLPGQALARMERRISVVLRYDDYSSLSATDLEIQMIKALHRYRIPCTFAVIPDICSISVHDPAPQKDIPLTYYKTEILKTAVHEGVAEIALHGYTHQTLPVANGRYSEFAGRDYSGQVRRIVQGKRYLEAIFGLKIDTFVPPWDHYDLNTVRALEMTGFKTLSASVFGVVPTHTSLNLMPGSCDLTHLKKAVLIARRNPDPHPVIVVLFHQYDFREINPLRGHLTYPDFVGLLQWIAAQPDLRPSTLGQAARLHKGLTLPPYKTFVYGQPKATSPPGRPPRVQPIRLKDSFAPHPRA